jgi:ribonuclease P protein component
VLVLQRKMPRKYRLSRADFKNMRGFSRLQGQFFTLSYGTIPGRGCGAACVVAKKVAPRATARNRIRRRCTTVLRGLLPTALSRCYVFLAKKTASSASFDAIREDIQLLIVKAR